MTGSDRGRSCTPLCDARRCLRDRTRCRHSSPRSSPPGEAWPPPASCSSCSAISIAREPRSGAGSVATHAALSKTFGLLRSLFLSISPCHDAALLQRQPQANVVRDLPRLFRDAFMCCDSLRHRVPRRALRKRLSKPMKGFAMRGASTDSVFGACAEQSHKEPS